MERMRGGKERGGDSKATELERDRERVSIGGDAVQNKHGGGLRGQALHFP